MPIVEYSARLEEVYIYTYTTTSLITGGQDYRNLVSGIPIPVSDSSYISYLSGRDRGNDGCSHPEHTYFLPSQ